MNYNRMRTGVSRRFSVYLEIDGLRVRFGRLKQKGDFFCCDFLEEVVLPPLTIEKGVIYNVSVFNEVLNHFTHSYGLDGARVLLSAPYLVSLQGKKREFAVFQLILSVCKCGLFVERLFDQKVL